ncbi:MAG: hypothetical protein IPL61_38720 [Myxococcales bacterium]|nr:hypothetical protein [Myxococcales bacterium]
MTEPDDTGLVTRLRDLALVEIDALLSGVEGEAYLALLAAHAEELEDALGAARRRAVELTRTIAAGDPLTLLDAGVSARARDGGRDEAERVARRLTARASAARALARIDDVVAAVYPRLIEVDRRRANS